MLDVAPRLSTIGFFETLRAHEFARLDEQNIAYLDYAASGLYGASQVHAHTERLLSGVFGNPHSQHGPSRASEEALSEARAATLAFFDADPALYDVCFTANASAALKLVAESYPFSADHAFILSADNHNSVNGMGQYARAKGAPVTILPLDDDLRLDDAEARLRAEASKGQRGLFAFPVQSNFSGVRHPLDLVQTAQDLGFDVMLDAAGTGAVAAVSLRRYPADFLALSFYKLFGLPTGVGALIVRKEAMARLRRPWFAGGTVDFVSVEHQRHQLSAGPAGFEDGTPNFLDLAALTTGFNFLAQVPQTDLQTYLSKLAAGLLDGLQDLAHPDGSPVVQIYGPRDMTDRGCIIAFNVLRPDGTVIPFQGPERRASHQGIALRGGCFCNPGAAERAFGFGRHDTAAALDACADKFSLSAFQVQLGSQVPVGALRLSPGLATNQRDIDRAISLAASFASAHGQALRRHNPC